MSAVRANIANQLKSVVARWAGPPSMDELNGVLRLLCKWRGYALAETFFRHHGTIIYSGPFQGMDYVRSATEGALVPRLLGTYESELHPHLAAFARAGLDCVIDVGCAEGYYAVGLARQMPGVTVHAHDIDAKARTSCAELAAKNGVAERVVIGGEFQPEDFERFAGRRALVMVDTEGAELDILQPDRAPALSGMRIIVETHDGLRPGALATLTRRFEATHHIVRVDQAGKVFDAPAWLNGLGHLDQLLAVWEWRSFPTPWLVMTPKNA
ncbi:hypothetical protein [uncultured Phenylobacterium sp.]|uniref:hypothetical protein n=1 Tax=uncultured Phenylobacterium sp. TaxID=349273 RepID=UPI0025E2E92F|nr:hypothetical protein [uncultured Phenylobacterium sp.]